MTPKTDRQQVLYRANLGRLYGYVSVEIIKLGGYLIVERDRLARRRGITNARWQVLSVLRDGDFTVAQMARILGLSRQGLQRVVNWLTKHVYVRLVDNPHHHRSKLVTLAPEGEKLLKKLEGDQVLLMERYGSDFSDKQMSELLGELRKLSAAFEKNSRLKRNGMRRH